MLPGSEGANQAAGSTRERQSCALALLLADGLTAKPPTNAHVLLCHPEPVSFPPLFYPHCLNVLLPLVRKTEMPDAEMATKQSSRTRRRQVMMDSCSSAGAENWARPDLVLWVGISGCI